MTTCTQAFKLINVYYCKPMNAEGGLYVEVEADYARLTDSEAVAFAEKVASDFGFDATGRASAGIPWQYSLRMCRRAFWFYDISGRPAGLAPNSDAVIRTATVGPNCVYEHWSEDPRRK